MPGTSYDRDIKPENIGKLARAGALGKLRAYYKGTQYDGRPDFFTGQKAGSSETVPLRERKPCVIYKLPAASCQQVVRFTFGESRFPCVGVEEITADEAILGAELTADEAETVEDYIAALVEHGQVKPAMRRLMRPGLAVGTTVAILVIRDGYFRIDIADAEHCFPRFRHDDPKGELESLTWSYQYERTSNGPMGPECKRYWYRQDITADAYIVYAPELVEQGVEPRWTAQTEVKHGLGFCPARWIRNLPEHESTDIDGLSLFEGLTDEFDALNFALSQRHRGIHHFGTPQPWETGVDEDDGPGATGRKSSTPGYSPAGKSPHGATGEAARKAGPDRVWSYRGQGVRVGAIETTGKAFEVATAHVNDIRTRVLESMSVVLVNIADVAGRTQQGQMSAKFLELAYEPLLALVDEMRHCWWPDGLQALLSMMLRATAALSGKDLLVPGAVKAAAILKRFLVTTSAGPMWIPPKMTPTWGDYFAAGPDEVAAAILAATGAKEAHLVPDEDAIKYVLPYFGREDAPEAIAEIEQDKQEAQDQALETMQGEALALHAAAGTNDATKPGGGAARGGKPPKNAKAGGGNGAPATSPAGTGG